jgi:hypothetical protein
MWSRATARRVASRRTLPTARAQTRGAAPASAALQARGTRRRRVRRRRAAARARGTPVRHDDRMRPRAGEWYHVVGTREQATRTERVYVDGVLSGKTICAGVCSRRLGRFESGAVNRASRGGFGHGTRPISSSPAASDPRKQAPFDAGARGSHRRSVTRATDMLNARAVCPKSPRG